VVPAGRYSIITPLTGKHCAEAAAFPDPIDFPEARFSVSNLFFMAEALPNACREFEARWLTL
jgi:hypothetical protein